MTTIVNTTGYTGSTAGLKILSDFDLFPATPAAGLLALYEFGQGSGTVLKDTSGNGNDGTIIAGAGGWNAEGSGFSYLFDGAASVIDTPVVLAGGCTIAAIVNADAAQSANFGAIVSNMSSGAAGATLSFAKSNAPGSIYGQSSGNIGWQGQGGDLIAGSWHLLVETIPAAANGSALISDLTLGVTGPLAFGSTYVPGSALMSIGWNPTHANIGASGAFKGKVAMIAVWSTALLNTRSPTNPSGLSQFGKIQQFANSSILTGRGITV